MNNDSSAEFHGELDRRSFLEQALAILAGAGAATMTGYSSAEEPPAYRPAPKGATLRFFPGFEAIRVQTSQAVINGVVGGSGPPLFTAARLASNSCGVVFRRSDAGQAFHGNRDRSARLRR